MEEVRHRRSVRTIATLFASNLLHGLGFLWGRRKARYSIPIHWKACLSVGLLASAAVMAILDPVVIYPDIDRKSDLFHLATYWTHYGKSGTYLFPAALALIALGFVDWRRRTRPARIFGNRCALALTFVLVSVAGSAIVTAVLKQVIGRARPREYDSVGTHFFDPFTMSANFASFPSGHATAAGAAAACLALLFPSLRVPVLAVGAALASTRAIVGSHYPADVVAGFLLGVWFSYAVAVVLARRGCLFKVSRNVPSVAPSLLVLAGKLRRSGRSSGGKTILVASTSPS